MNKIRQSGIRSTVGEFIHVGSRINPIFITTEINATKLKAYCARQSVTYTPVLMKIIAGIKNKYPIMNSVLARGITLRKNIYFFDDVDMSVGIEKTVGDVRFITTPVIKKVNRKSVSELHEEIKYLSALPFNKRPDVKPLLLFNILPSFIKYIVLRIICQSHILFSAFFGTVGLTNLGNVGIGYIYPHWLNNVVFGIGSLESKPIVAGTEIIIAPVLPVTLAFNHAALDGLEAGQILAEFRRIIESGEFPSPV